MPSLRGLWKALRRRSTSCCRAWAARGLTSHDDLYGALAYLLSAQADAVTGLNLTVGGGGRALGLAGFSGLVRAKVTI